MATLIAPAVLPPSEDAGPIADAGPVTVVRLEWAGPEHWSETPGPCRHCHTPTRFRDATDRPAHPSCAAAALTAELFGGGDR